MSLTGVFLLYLAQRFLKGKSGPQPQSNGEILTDLFGELISAVAGNLAYDKSRSFAASLNKQGLPVRQEVHRAVEKAVLLAAMEAVRYCLRQQLFAGPMDERKLLTLQRQFKTDLREAESKAFQPVTSNPLVDQITYLDLAQIPAAKEDELRNAILDYLIKEKLNLALWGHYSDTNLPPALTQCLLNGWTENGRSYNLFTFICDYFHQELVANATLQQIIEKQWLAQVVDNTNDTRGAISALQNRLAALGESVIGSVGKIDKLLAYANPQPLLFYQTDELSREKPAHYKSRYTPFVGRDEELKQLLAFFGAEAPLAWWVVSGAGGSGKNRLAMEFCYYLEDRYNVLCGIMTGAQLQQFNWAAWQPESSTFIIIDYAGKDVEKIAETIQELYIRKEQLHYPVRFLLLERHTHNTTWWRTLDNNYITPAKIPGPWKEPLALAPLPGADLWELIRHILSRLNKPLPDQQQTMDTLARIDPSGRPIFAVLAAFSIEENGRINATDIRSLLEEHYHREIALLAAAFPDKAVVKKMFLLACFATMTDGLSWQHIQALINNNPAWLEISAKEFSNDVYRMIAGIDQSRPAPYLPIEPDIIGGFFVLQQFQPDPDNPFVESPVPLMIEQAWAEHGLKMFQFTFRLFDDFYKLIDLDVFLKTPLATDPAARKMNWCHSMFIAIGVTTVADYPIAQRLYERFSRYVKDNRDDGHLFVQHLIAAEGLVRFNTDPANKDYFLTLADELSSLAYTGPLPPDVLKRYIALLEALAEYGSGISDVWLIKDIYLRFIRLLTEKTAEVDKALDNFCLAFSGVVRYYNIESVQAGYTEGVWESLDMYKNSLLDTLPAEKVLENFAECLSHSINYFIEMEQWPVSLYASYMELALEHTGSPRLAAAFIDVNTDLALYHLEKRALLIGIDDLFAHSEMAYDLHSADPDVTYKYLLLKNLYLMKLANAQRFREAFELFLEMASSGEMEAHPNLLGGLGKAGLHLLDKLIQKRQDRYVFRVFKALRDQGVKYKDDEMILEDTARAYLYHHRYLFNNKKLDQMLANYNEYKSYITGVEMHNMIEHRAEMLSTLIENALAVKRKADASRFLDELLETAAAYPAPADMHFFALYALGALLEKETGPITDFDQWYANTRKNYLSIQLELVSERLADKVPTYDHHILDKIRKARKKHRNEEPDPELAQRYIQAALKLYDPLKALQFCRDTLFNKQGYEITELDIQLARQLIEKHRHEPDWQQVIEFLLRIADS
jgi:hypothetical protein